MTEKKVVYNGYDRLEIEGLPCGGYVVRERHKEPGMWCAEVAAFSSLTDALKWMGLNINIKSPNLTRRS